MPKFEFVFGLALCTLIEGKTCPYAGVAAAEEPEEQSLLATKTRIRRAGEQRADDWVLVPPPPPISPPGGSRNSNALIPEPLPPPNPADNPLINGYIPMHCRNETWPFFVDAPGMWMGDQGQNFIALPQANARPAGKQFLVMVNSYSETLTLESTGEVLNRGFMNGVQTPPVKQADQVFRGVRYAQVITDMDSKSEIHAENGFILHQACSPVNGALADAWEVTRFSAIPHGSQPMGFGNMSIVETPDENYYIQNLLRVRNSFVFSVQPFVPGCGTQFQQQATPGNTSGPFADAAGTSCCIGGAGYMKGTDQCPATGCPEPIDVLIQAVKGLNVVNYVQFNITTADVLNPFVRDGMWEPGIHGGGVQNTAFVNINAMAEPLSYRNVFWYLTVREKDGSEYNLIQYIQTVNLKFLRKRAGCPDQLWPHVDANTLRRVETPTTTATTPPPTPAPTPATSAANCPKWCDKWKCGWWACMPCSFCQEKKR